MTTTLDDAGLSPASNESAPPAATPRARVAAALPMTLVLLLSFVLASVPARNSDVWRHLATGRALLDGTYTFGTDPFAYTTDGVPWINHAWLYDALLFGLHHVAGTYLVVASAVLVVVLAALMLLAAKPWHSPWTASFSVAVALVAQGPYLRLEPAVLSLVLLGFTLWWLWRIEDAPDADRPIWTHWPLLLAVAVWANCDDWFLLGPVTVGLFWLGKALASHRLHGRLLGVFVLSLAVCLLNPHHVRVFAVPAALSDAALAPGSAVTPLAAPLAALRNASTTAIPVALAAYFLLILLGLLTLLGSTARRSWPQLLIWFALLGVSLYRASAIPFFAVAAGPFLARGWQRSVAQPAQPASPRRKLVGPVLGAIALTALVVAACPGWLQSTGERRGWFVRTDPSLEQLAAQLTEWRRTGQLDATARGFNFSVDAAHYLEWYCPAEKVFIDGRANLFPAAVVAEFQQVHDALAANPYAPRAAPLADMDPVIQRWGVTHLVVADPVERTLVAALIRLWAVPEEWPLVGLDGRAAVFARQTPAGRQPSVPPLRLPQRAFAVDSASTAPRHGAAEPEPRPWWDCVVWPAGADALDRDEALCDIVYFEAQRLAFPARNFAAWQVEMSTAIFGLMGPTVAPDAVAAGLPLAVLAATRQPIPKAGPSWLDRRAHESIIAHAHRVDEGPPGALLLAIRAARRAIHTNPNDAFAYLRLGHAYLLLHQNTAERALTGEFGLLAELRRVQAITALTTALKVRPDLDIAHELLFTLYQRAGWIDLALEQLQQQLALAKRAGPRPGESLAEFTIRTDRLAAIEQQLGKLVREQMNLVDTQAVNLKVYGKAHLAESRGLLGYALSILQDPRYGYLEFGIEGAVLELHLLLYTGHIREARSWLDPRQEAKMGAFHYGWLQTLLAAADGDYDTAAEALERITVTVVPLPELGLPRLQPRTALGLAFGQDLLLHAAYVVPPMGLGMVSLLAGNQSLLPPTLQPLGAQGWVRRLENLANVPHEQADLYTLRGLLALEWGGVESAERDFRAARAAWDGNFGSAALARRYQALLAQP